jgi:hypothetical protein
MCTQATIDRIHSSRKKTTHRLFHHIYSQKHKRKKKNTQSSQKNIQKMQALIKPFRHSSFTLFRKEARKRSIPSRRAPCNATCSRRKNKCHFRSLSARYMILPATNHVNEVAATNAIANIMRIV